jgi:hypothetical protein
MTVNHRHNTARNQAAPAVAVIGAIGAEGVDGLLRKSRVQTTSIALHAIQATS